jgi:hypothetical protein
MGCVGSTRRSALFTCWCLCFGCAPPVKWSSRVNQVHVGLDDCMRDGEGTRGMDVLTFAVKVIGARLQVARWASCRVGCSMPRAGHCMSSVDGVGTGRGGEECMLCGLRGMGDGTSSSTTSKRAWVPTRDWLHAHQLLVACQHSTHRTLVLWRRVDV